MAEKVLTFCLSKDAVPTPDTPVPIVSAGDGGSVVVTLSDGAGETQVLTLSTPDGLPGIPVTSGGSYTDKTGQQWVCDEVDLERGVRVKRISIIKISPDFPWVYEPNDNNRFGAYALSLNCNDSFGYAQKITHYGVKGYGENGWVASNNIRLHNWQNFTSVSEFKDWLAANNVYAYCAAKNVTENLLTADEIAAYKALTTYAPTTVVQASDGAGIKLDYQRDVNLVVKNLEDAIASMTTT